MLKAPPPHRTHPNFDAVPLPTYFKSFDFCTIYIFVLNFLTPTPTSPKTTVSSSPFQTHRRQAVANLPQNPFFAKLKILSHIMNLKTEVSKGLSFPFLKFGNNNFLKCPTFTTAYRCASYFCLPRRG